MPASPAASQLTPGTPPEFPFSNLNYLAINEFVKPVY